jgi:hypothetical protein
MEAANVPELKVVRNSSFILTVHYRTLLWRGQHSVYGGKVQILDTKASTAVQSVPPDTWQYLTLRHNYFLPHLCQFALPSINRYYITSANESVVK